MQKSTCFSLWNFRFFSSKNAQQALKLRGRRSKMAAQAKWLKTMTKHGFFRRKCTCKNKNSTCKK